MTLVEEDALAENAEKIDTTESAILVIDDEPMIVELMTAALQQGGFTAFGTTDPDEAVRLVETNPSIKLVLSDVMMPTTTGPEVVRRALKLRNDNVRVLFMSGGFGGTRFRQTDRLLDKPMTFKNLLDEVRRTLSEMPVFASWDGPERRRKA